MFLYKIKSGKGVVLKNETYHTARIQEQLWWNYLFYYINVD